MLLPSLGSRPSGRPKSVLRDKPVADPFGHLTSYAIHVAQLYLFWTLDGIEQMFKSRAMQMEVAMGKRNPHRQEDVVRMTSLKERLHSL